MAKAEPQPKYLIKDRVLHATGALMSCFLPFMSALPDTLPHDVESGSSQTTSSRRSNDDKSFSQYNETGVDIIVCTSGLRRKGSHVGKLRKERRRNCRRVKFRRDLSGELEESEYRLPFPISIEEIERGGRPMPMRIATFSDGMYGRLPPTLDISFVGHGSIIDIEFPVMDEGEGKGREAGIEGGGLESSEADMSLTNSEWDTFAKEAEGIEMFF